MTTTTFKLIVTVDVEHKDNVDPREVLEEMDYKFKSNTKGAKITDSSIEDAEKIKE